MALHYYLPQDRLRALADQRGLPEQAEGAALFSDICGFTTLTETLAQRHGERGGVEAMSQAMSEVYDGLIAAVEQSGGSTLAFAGDALCCWFDSADDAAAGAPAATRAVQAALAMQATIQAAPVDAAPLALKVSVARGPVRRLTVGDPSIQTLDVLTGATVARAALADTLAGPGDVLLDEATAHAVQPGVVQWRRHSGGTAYAVVDPAWRGPPMERPPAPRPAVAVPPPDVLRPWVLPFVFERESSGRGLFVTDLRPVVALFLRFGGLGDEAGDLDDAAVQRLDRWIGGAQRLLHAHGGVLLELTIGDKGSYLYAAFGAAQAHEDDARRAVRAALALIGLFDDGSPGAGACIGLASGTLRVGGYGGRTRQSFGAQGDAVNAAARLMGQARQGEVLVSGRVRGAVAQEFAFQARPPIALKGKAEPMPVFALLGPQRQRALHLQEPDFVLPMVGRDAAVQQIEQALGRARGGRGSVLAVVAEAGMGKSRLLAEGVRLALRQGFVGYGGATAGDAGRTPYRPWHDVWAALLELSPAPSPRLHARAIETAVARLAPDHAEAWPLIGAALGLDLADNGFTRGLAPKDRKALLEAVLVQALATTAREAAQDGGGVLLVLEDLHAADALSMDLLAAVARAIAALPVLLLLSQRPPAGADETDVLRCLAAARLVETPVERIELAGLDATQSEQLIRAKLAALFPERTGALPAVLIERIVERAQGNPFCVEELLNHLHDRGLDPRRADTVQALDWPVSLHLLVLSRLDRLAVPQQMELKVASVIGRQFALAAVFACHPAVGSLDALCVDLRELTRLGLTAEAPDEPDLSFLFKHRVTLEVAYASLSQTSRVQLHAQVACYLMARSPDSPAWLAPTLAHHWACAERPDQAWPHLKRAAEQAAAVYANAQALAAFAQVLGWLPADATRERIDVLFRCEALHDLTGSHAERRRVLADLDALADRIAAGDEAMRLRRRIALRRAALELDIGDFAAAERGALAALGAAEAASDTGPADAAHDIDALLLLARAMFSAGRAVQARAPLARARDLAQAHRLAGRQAHALARLGLVEWQTGHYDDAERPLLAALATLRAAGDLRGELDVLNNLGVVAKSRARFAQAVSHYEQAQAIARRIGDRSGEAVLLNNMGSAALAAGDFHRAAQDAERAAQIWAALDEPSQLGAALCNRAEAHRELGQYEAARAVGEQALALLRASGLRRIEATVLENLGRVAAAEGDRERAMQLFGAALALAREIGLRAIEASTLLDIGRLHTEDGQVEHADTALAAAGRLMTELGDPLGVLEVQAARATRLLLDATRADAERARAARAELEPLVTRLLAPAEDEAAAPMALYLVAWRVLRAAGDERAAALLLRAHAELRERAARIAEPSTRRAYLQVAEHHALLAA
jgi:class 3 adenylate cyclase/tetratricopeptide (TPR) repeat protein